MKLSCGRRIIDRAASCHPTAAPSIFGQRLFGHRNARDSRSAAPGAEIRHRPGANPAYHREDRVVAGLRRQHLQKVLEGRRLPEDHFTHFPVVLSQLTLAGFRWDKA